MAMHAHLQQKMDNIAVMKSIGATSREIIRTNDPRLFVVQLPFGANDYRFVWTISSNRAVELRGYGDFRKLDGASVAIREFRAYNR